MKIELNNTENTKNILTLSDDGLDNTNFVNLSFWDVGEVFDLEELLSALQAFQQKRVMKITREDKYSE